MRISVGAVLLALVLPYYSTTALLFPPLPETTTGDEEESRRRYIVQLASPCVIEHSEETKLENTRKLDFTSESVQQYSEYLESEQDEVLSTVGVLDKKLYRYMYSFNGFSAVLTPLEAKALAAEAKVINVWEDEVHELNTDGSYDFLGLSGGGEPWSLGFTGEDVVVGIIDTGVNPEHPSFNDTETPMQGNTGDLTPYGAIPTEFNATGCSLGNQDFNENDAPFECNNKLVLAKCFAGSYSTVVNASLPCGGDGSFLARDEFLSARDSQDHGSHVASTAVGNFLSNVSLNGQAARNITGMAPRARLAVYKACWTDILGNGGCRSSDTLAAIDEAVKDGVDVINYSIGGPYTTYGPHDMAFLRATDAGIHVTTSQGNAGPNPGTVGTPASVPWITAVGASADDGVTGLVVNIESPPSIVGPYRGLQARSPVQIADLSGVMAGDIVPAEPLNACSALQNNLTDKIALVIRGGCTFTSKFNNVTAAGAKFIVVYNDGARPDRISPATMTAPNTTIPGVMISYNDGLLLYNTASTQTETNETVTVSGSVLSMSLENMVAEFSSRGPNRGALGIIKPDIVAPGVDILAASTPFTAGGPDDGDTFKSLRGTSMSSPHVAGLLALLKQAHPDWSPAIAKSALMTTARQDLTKNLQGDPADPFDMGSGHVVPQDAFDPGLVFDTGLAEYEAFICGRNEATSLISQSKCVELAALGYSSSGRQLNYPSIAVSEFAGAQTITRTVTCVANTTGPETFTVSVDPPPGVGVFVNPSSITLSFGETATYEVVLTANDQASFDEWSFGSMTWSNTGGGNLRGNSNTTYSVRSPIAVKPANFMFPPTVIGYSSTDSLDGPGPSGSVSFNIGFSFSGTYKADCYGLASPIALEAHADRDPIKRYRFPEGGGIKRFVFKYTRDTILARFALKDDFNSIAGSDLDMHVWSCPESIETFTEDRVNIQVCALVGESRNPNSDEFFDVPYPKVARGAYGTQYIVDVHAFDIGEQQNSLNFTLFHWDVRVNGNYDNMIVNEAPADAIAGTSSPVTVSWPGTNQLDPNTTYLGATVHTGPDGVLGLSALEIST